jgi:hypothetical protein
MKTDMINRITNYDILYDNKEYSLEEEWSVNDSLVYISIFDMSGEDITNTDIGIEIIKEYKKDLFDKK